MIGEIDDWEGRRLYITCDSQITKGMSWEWAIKGMPGAGGLVNGIYSWAYGNDDE
jgi:hypothetical protein